MLTSIFVLLMLPNPQPESHRQLTPERKKELQRVKLDESCVPVFNSISNRLNWNGRPNTLDADAYIAFVQIDEKLRTLDRITSVSERNSDGSSFEAFANDLRAFATLTADEDAVLTALIAADNLVQSASPGGIPPAGSDAVSRFATATAVLSAKEREQFRLELVAAWAAAGHDETARALLNGEGRAERLARPAALPVRGEMAGSATLAVLRGKLAKPLSSSRAALRAHLVLNAERQASLISGTSKSGSGTIPWSDEKKKKHYQAFIATIEELLGRKLDEKERVLASRLGMLNYNAGKVVHSINRFAEEIRLQKGN